MTKILMFLATIFLIIWIVIGLYMLLVLYSNIRRGALQSMFSIQPGQTQQPQAPPEAPTETEIPGVGKVNVACVQNTLSPQSIQELVVAQNVSALNGEERERFEKCLVSGESSPSEDTKK